MLFVGTSIIHPSTEGVFLLCNILDLLIYSFLLVFGLTLICALPAGSSYRSEREKQEAAEQRRIQELHNEFLTQKD